MRDQLRDDDEHAGRRQRVGGSHKAFKEPSKMTCRDTDEGKKGAWRTDYERKSKAVAFMK